MGAPTRVLTQDIVNALLRERGNVKAAAESLGLSRKGLYKRVISLGLDLGGFRAAAGHVTPMPTVGTMGTNVCDTGTRTNSDRAPKAKAETGGHFKGSATASRLPTVEKAGAVLDQIRLQARPRQQQPARLEPEQVEELQRVRLEIQARTGVEMTNSDLARQFFKQCFGPWADEILSAPKSGRKRSAEGQDR